jgi:hypothetical protein
MSGDDVANESYTRGTVAAYADESLVAAASTTRDRGTIGSAGALLIGGAYFRN